MLLFNVQYIEEVYSLSFIRIVVLDCMRMVVMDTDVY
jgi:hypothetical protein